MIVITGYTGSGGAVAIPGSINVVVNNNTLSLPVTSIGEEAFYKENITMVTIPSNVTSIGDFAFQDCRKLTSVSIPTGVTSIGMGAFEGTGLTSVSIPASVTSIGDEPFESCPNLHAITVDLGNPDYSSVGGVLFDLEQTTLIQYPAGKNGSSYAVPNGVTSIAYRAFGACDSLTNVTIPASVTRIGQGPFEYCSSLGVISVDPDNPAYISSDGVLLDINETTIIQYPAKKSGTAYIIPNTVTSIGEGAFTLSTSLISITIPSSVTSIGDFAFYDCTSLTGAYFQGNAPAVGEEIFDLDTNATAYYLPDTTGWSSPFAGIPAMLSEPPVFSTQPGIESVMAGKSATFMVAASGIPTPTYQWQRQPAGSLGFINLSNSGTYSGVTTTTLRISKTNVGMTGDQFQCVATNGQGAATSLAGDLVVYQGSATVTLSSLIQTFTGTPRAVKVTTKPSGLAFTLTYNGSASAPTNVGNYTVEATVKDIDYSGSATATLVINKAAATVTLSNLTQTYTGTPLAVTVTTSPAGLAYDLTYNGSTTAPAVPGNYAVVATVTDANHSGSASGTLVIKPVAATVTLSNLSQTYDGNPKSVTVATNPAGLAYNVTYNGSATPPVDGGSHAVVATITDPYSSGTKSGTLVISKAAQTITFGPLAAAKVGDGPLTLTATASSGLPVMYASSNAAVATVSNGVVTFVGLGKATITATQGGDADYNAASSKTQILSVSQSPMFTTPPAGQAVAAGVKATFKVAAGGTAPITYQWQREAAGTSTFVNLANGGSYAGVTTTTLSVSNTTVAMSGDQFRCVAVNSVDSVISDPATLTVTKAAAKVTLSNLAQTYTGTPRPVKVATTPAGLTYDLTYNGSSTAPTDAGNYTVEATITDDNHTGSANGILVIKPATATVTLGNLKQTYDGTAKSVTVTTKPTGLSFTVTYNGSATPPMDAGSYPVVVTVTDANSTGTGKGTLVIAKKAQTITFDSLSALPANAGSTELSATADSGLAVTYKSSNPAVASVNNGILNIEAKGTAVITAMQSGNTNYLAAPNVARIQTVTAAYYGGGGGGGSVIIGGAFPPLSPYPALARPSLVSSGTTSSNTTSATFAITSAIMNDADSAAWVGELDPGDTNAGPSPTAADLPVLLLQAMNLDVTSPDDLLPIPAIETVDDVPYFTLQFRQSKDPTAPVLVAQYSTDGVTWFDVPASDLTELPDDDDGTARWSARVAVPDIGPVYLRVIVELSP